MKGTSPWGDPFGLQYFGPTPVGIITIALVVQADTARQTMRCAVCGYGVSVLFEPAACPMCQTTPWPAETQTSAAAQDPRLVLQPA